MWHQENEESKDNEEITYLIGSDRLVLVIMITFHRDDNTIMHFRKEKSLEFETVTAMNDKI